MVILQLGSKFDWAGKFIRYFKHLHYSVFRRTSYKKYEKSYTLQFAKLCSLQFSLYQIMQNFHSGRIKKIITEINGLIFSRQVKMLHTVKNANL